MNKNLDLFFIFFKLGLFTFGGGYAMIPQIKREIVEKRKWMSEDEMIEVIAIAEATPGPIAINMATYVGYKQNKILGSVASTIGVVIPSLVIIFLISLFFNSFIENKYISYCFKGIKCGVSFLIIKVAIEMIVKLEKKLSLIIILVLTFISSICIEIFNINFSSIYLIIIGAVLGIILYSKNKALEMEKNDDLS